MAFPGHDSLLAVFAQDSAAPATSRAPFDKVDRPYAVQGDSFSFETRPTPTDHLPMNMTTCQSRWSNTTVPGPPTAISLASTFRTHPTGQLSLCSAELVFWSPLPERTPDDVSFQHSAYIDHVRGPYVYTLLTSVFELPTATFALGSTAYNFKKEIGILQSWRQEQSLVGYNKKWVS